MRNNVLNGIMGLCVGDALGVPVEFEDRETLIENPVVGMRAFGTYSQPAGTWSDDTSMTLCLADSLINNLNYNDIMNSFMRWFNNAEYTPFGVVFDIGNATRKALRRFAGGTTPLECGGLGDSDNGNGSLMRILPIACYLQSIYENTITEHNEAMNVIHNVSSLTHAHKRCLIACGIYCSIACKIMEGEDLVIAIESGIYGALEYYKRHDEYAYELCNYERLSYKTFEQSPTELIKSSGYVVDTLEAAIWCLLNTKSYKDCVLKAVNLGEDTDTIAAVAGGLAGLYYGYDAIPEEWLSAIVKRDYIESLCNKLFKVIYKHQ